MGGRILKAIFLEKCELGSSSITLIDNYKKTDIVSMVQPSGFLSVSQFCPCGFPFDFFKEKPVNLVLDFFSVGYAPGPPKAELSGLF